MPDIHAQDVAEPKSDSDSSPPADLSENPGCSSAVSFAIRLVFLGFLLVTGFFGVLMAGFSGDAGPGWAFFVICACVLTYIVSGLALLFMPSSEFSSGGSGVKTLAIFGGSVGLGFAVPMIGSSIEQFLK